MLIFLLLTALSVQGFSVEASTNLNGEELRLEMLSWLESFTSLQCTYVFRLNTSSGSVKEEEVKYRWQEDMEYFEKLTVVPPTGVERAEPVGSLSIESLVNGNYTLLTHQNQGVTGEVNRESFYSTNATRLIRHLLLEAPLEKREASSPGDFGLHTILSAPGIAKLFKADDGLGIMYWSEGRSNLGMGVNVYLDEEKRVRRIEYVGRPPCSPEEVQQWSTKDPYDVFQLLSSVELMNYELFSGIWLPCSIREKMYWVTSASMENLKPLGGRYGRGEISLCELVVKRMEGVEYEPGPVLEINIDRQTVRVNEKLTKSDFEIEIPPNTPLVDKSRMEVFTTAQETWLERHADLLIILVTLVFLGGITVFGWRYWRGRA